MHSRGGVLVCCVKDGVRQLHPCTRSPEASMVQEAAPHTSLRATIVMAAPWVPSTTLDSLPCRPSVPRLDSSPVPLAAALAKMVTVSA